MESVIDELKTSSILTKEEIERIKLYVDKKYPNNSSKENAKILSRTIHQVLDSNLEGIDGEYKENIKKAIIETTILKDKKSIFRWDIFNACISKLEETPELKTSIVHWINKNQGNDVSQERFNCYVSDIHKVSNIDKLPYIKIEGDALSSSNVEAKEAVFKSYEEVLPERNNSGNKFYNIKKVLQDFKLNKEKIYSKKVVFALLTLLIFISCSLNTFIMRGNKTVAVNKNNGEVGKASVPAIGKADLYAKDIIGSNTMSYHPHLPEYFNYKNIDKGKLLEFLNSRNSILAEEPYFSAIINVSREFNLNPYILFAITGQEQSFVPKDHENAEKIANNPFNVFHSWQDYNTDIYDSSKIAARTVINLAKDKPSDIDIFDWINNKYAGDKNWGKGVREIFESFGE